MSDAIGPPFISALLELVDADHRDHGIPDRSVPHDCRDFHYPCPATEPPFDCLTCECCGSTDDETTNGVLDVEDNYVESIEVVKDGFLDVLALYFLDQIDADEVEPWARRWAEMRGHA